MPVVVAFRSMLVVVPGCFELDRPDNLMSSLVWRYWYRNVPYDMVQLVINGLHNPRLSQ